MSTNDDPIAVQIPQPCFKRTHETSRARTCRDKVNYEKLTFRFVWYDTTEITAFVKSQQEKKNDKIKTAVNMLCDSIMNFFFIASLFKSINSKVSIMFVTFSIIFSSNGWHCSGHVNNVKIFGIRTGNRWPSEPDACHDGNGPVKNAKHLLIVIWLPRGERSLSVRPPFSFSWVTWAIKKIYTTITLNALQTTTLNWLATGILRNY